MQIRVRFTALNLLLKHELPEPWIAWKVLTGITHSQRKFDCTAVLLAGRVYPVGRRPHLHLHLHLRVRRDNQASKQLLFLYGEF
jgi:hypothetical protein